MDSNTQVKTYEEWQEKHAPLLMDGTSSIKSYIRTAYFDNGRVEFGIQPRIGRCSGNMIGFAFRLRCAYVKDPPAGRVPDPDDVKEGQTNVVAFPDLSPGAKSAKIQHLIDYGPGIPWQNFDTSRVSVVGHLHIPANPAEGAQFLKLINDGVLKTLLESLKQPLGGFFAEDHVLPLLNEYVLVSADQFNLFVEPLSSMTPATSLSETQQEWLDKLLAKGNTDDAEATADASSEAAPAKPVGDEIPAND